MYAYLIKKNAPLNNKKGILFLWSLYSPVSNFILNEALAFSGRCPLTPSMKGFVFVQLFKLAQFCDKPKTTCPST